jgi:4-amino-4-deoxy-L-arabinose transferase-like glycosyltransferase
MTLATMYCGARLTKEQDKSFWFFLGAFSVLSILARTQSAFFVMPLCLVIIIHRMTSKTLQGKSLSIYLVGAALIVGAQMCNTAIHTGKASLHPSDNSALVLMFGTNVESSGRFNHSDLNRIHWLSPLSDEDRARALEQATSLALTRIASDPIGFLKFAMTTKVRELWNPVESLVWAGANQPPADTYLFFLETTSRIGVIALLILTLFSLFLAQLGKRSLGSSDTIMLISCIAGILSIEAVHIFFEVQGRYSLFVYPFLLVISAIGIFKFAKPAL